VEEIAEDGGGLAVRVAGLDIGKASLVACVRVPHDDPAGRRQQEVRTFGTVTGALLELRDWLVCEGVTRVVMESTSAYWKPPFYVLEDAVAECWLVNAREVRNVPGRPKTDLLTELPEEVPGAGGRRGFRVATVAGHDHRRRCAAGLVAAGDAAARVA
jgi:hypothetical protein